MTQLNPPVEGEAMSAPAEEKKIRVLLVDDVTETRDNLKKLLYFEDDIEVVGGASNGREGVDQAAALHPDIVLMDINMPGMDGIAASELISSASPDVQVIMMSVQSESDYLRRSMLAGAREFLIKPFSSEELSTAIRRVHQLAQTRRASMPQVAASQVAAVAAPPAKPVGAKIIAIYSPKGGSGVSTLAVNLALALKELTKQRVAVVDASLQYGDVAMLLNLYATRSITDATEGTPQPDEDIMNSVLATHSSGLKVLLAPSRPELAELVTPDHVRSILGVMQRMFDYIVVDTGKAINDVLLAILDAAEQIILISTADIGALKNARVFFEVTDKLDYPATKTILILDKYDGRSGITPRDIEGNVKHAVSGWIPRDDRVTEAALNRGIPFILTNRGSQVSQAIFALARLLSRPPESVPEGAPAPAPARARPAPPQPPAMKQAKRRRWLFFNFGGG